jgi:hypothetical protein
VYNAKPLVASALSTDAALIALIPKVQMFDGSAKFKEAPIYPYLTYEEIGNIEGLHSDDEEVESEVTFKIHLWGPDSLSTIAGHVNRVMKSQGFGRNYSYDQDETLDTGQVIKHKIMSYTNTYAL